MITVRTATLDDCEAVSRLARARISVWQRLDAQGRVETVPYEALTQYERWSHGGPLISPLLGAIHLNTLLLGAGLPLVAERDGYVVGYAEAYPGAEPEPFGLHVHIGELYANDGETAAALLDAVKAQAKAWKCARVAIGPASGEAAYEALHASGRCGSLGVLRRFSIPARPGQGLYKAVDEPSDDARLIANWHMPLGRTTSARQVWENAWAHTWDALLGERLRLHRLRFNAAGHDALVCFQQNLYNPRVAEVYCWSPKALSAPLLTALRDWAHREGYRSLSLLTPEALVSALGPDAEADGYAQTVYAVGV